MLSNSSTRLRPNSRHEVLENIDEQPLADDGAQNRSGIKSKIPSIDLSQRTDPSVLSAEVQLLEELVAAGQMTSIQRDIVMHDQAHTGMTIAEVLIARGWL